MRCRSRVAWIHGGVDGSGGDIDLVGVQHGVDGSDDGVSPLGSGNRVKCARSRSPLASWTVDGGSFTVMQSPLSFAVGILSHARTSYWSADSVAVPGSMTTEGLAWKKVASGDRLGLSSGSTKRWKSRCRIKRSRKLKDRKETQLGSASPGSRKNVESCWNSWSPGPLGAQCRLAKVDHAARVRGLAFASLIVAGPSWRVPVSPGFFTR